MSRIWVGLILALALPGAAYDAIADGSSGVSLGLALQRSTSQALLIGDSRPLELAAAGGAIEVGVPLFREVRLVLAGDLSGTWYDFDNGAGNSGNIKVLVPGLRIGPVIDIPLGGRLGLGLGGQFEYSELRSWSHSRVAFLPYDVTGPRNFRRGGVLQAEVYARQRRMQPFIRAASGLALVHAKVPSFSSSYRWLSVMGAITVGLRLKLTR